MASKSMDISNFTEDELCKILGNDICPFCFSDEL